MDTGRSTVAIVGVGVGVGVMGSAIAGRLLDRGHAVTLFDLDPAKLAPLAGRGAAVAASPAEACRAARFTILGLNAAAGVRAAVFGPGGAAEGGAPDTILVDMSSIDPAATRALAAELRALRGMAWVDAPLSGGAPGAAAGRLTVMAGGRADSRILQKFGPKMAARDEAPTGRIDNMLKDLEAVQGFALAERLPLPVTALVSDLHRQFVRPASAATRSR